MISMFLVVKECFIPHPRLPDLIGIQKQVLMLGYCILRKRVRDAAFFFIIMLVTFAATLLKPQKYVSSRTIQKCVEHVSTST